MANDATTLINFPCDFPLKIIGSNSIDIVPSITNIILKHYPQTPLANIAHTESARNNYISITATVHAYDQITLDALYLELTQFPGIKMVL